MSVSNTKVIRDPEQAVDAFSPIPALKEAYMAKLFDEGELNVLEASDRIISQLTSDGYTVSCDPFDLANHLLDLDVSEDTELLKFKRGEYIRGANEGEYGRDFDGKKLTVLNFSGGKQSSALLWMLIRGDLDRPENLVVLNADPGMENSRTYDYIDMMFDKCEKVGIEAYTVPGPNLYEDLIRLPETDKSRFDNPPYWTKANDGSVGRLRQKCTSVYKIAPMDKEIRRILDNRYDIPRDATNLGHGIVEKWIGFGYDEVDRVKPPSRKYIRFRYPLIEMEMSKQDVTDYYESNNLPIPDRSVCNACFANDLDTFEEMYEERPSDWEQAVKVDEAVRDLSQIGVHDEVYVSHAAKPLKVLADEDFDLNDQEGELQQRSCDSGYCFI